MGVSAPGHAAAGHAPMIAIKLIGRQIEYGQFGQAGRCHRRQQLPNRRDFRSFPRQTRTNIERLDPAIAIQERAEQNGAVQAAAQQQTDGRVGWD